MEDGATAEMGLVATTAWSASRSSWAGDAPPNQMTVVVAGDAPAAGARAARGVRGRWSAALLLRYTQSLITQISYSAVCNRLHAVRVTAAAGC